MFSSKGILNGIQSACTECKGAVGREALSSPLPRRPTAMSVHYPDVASRNMLPWHGQATVMYRFAAAFAVYKLLRRGVRTLNSLRSGVMWSEPVT